MILRLFANSFFWLPGKRREPSPSYLRYMELEKVVSKMELRIEHAILPPYDLEPLISESAALETRIGFNASDSLLSTRLKNLSRVDRDLIRNETHFHQDDLRIRALSDSERQLMERQLHGLERVKSIRLRRRVFRRIISARMIPAEPRS